MQVRQVQDIQYQSLPGAERRTTDIVIERDGMVSVRPPLRMTPEQVDATVFSNRVWIYRNLAEWRDLNATKVVREWVNGESFCTWEAVIDYCWCNSKTQHFSSKTGDFSCFARSL